MPVSSHVRVAIIGSGFGGIGTAIRLKQSGIADFVIFERASDVGGADQFEPGTYNVGFKIIEMTPGDYDIFLKMFNTYGM